MMLSCREIWLGVTYLRTVCRNAISIYPRFKYSVRFPVVVVLKIVYPNEVGYRKVPYVAFADCRVVIVLIDTPLVRSAAPFNIGWSVNSNTLTASIYAGRIGCIGIGNSVSINPEVNIVLGCIISR